MILRAFSLILPALLKIAVPPTESDRLPYVPYPNGVPSVSECSIVDVVVWDAQLIRDELSERRLVTLPVRLRPGGHDDLTGQVDLDIGAFPQASAPAFALETDPFRRRHSADFDVG